MLVEDFVAAFVIILYHATSVCQSSGIASLQVNDTVDEMISVSVLFRTDLDC